MADLRASGLGGVPKGQTADRPSSPSIGDVFYNGTLGCLEIYTSQGWVANSAPPGIPDIGTVTYTATNQPYNNGTASVVFTPGQGGGLPNSYRATSTPGGYSGTGTSSPISVTGLQSGTSYTFSVTGTNNFGTSAASVSSNSITANTVPQAPTIGTLSYASDTSLSLTFTANATGGSAITNYKYSTDGITYTAFSPAQTTSPLTFTGLTPNTSYSYYIKAVNSVGDSVASQVSNLAATANTVVSGGTLYSDSNYYYRAFTGVGTLTVSNANLVTDILVVAGGGGSGNGTNVGAGGGAGGVVYATNKTLTVGTYNASTGGGGATDSNGINSTFGDITAFGGGRGGDESTVGGNGGSGGGSTWQTSYNIPGTSTQTSNGGGTGYGNAGGSNTVSGGNNHYPSGGGGGAGAVGGNGTSTLKGGDGGIGIGGNTIAALNAFGAATSTGQLSGGNYYYAGGGGGGSWVGSTTYSSGGLGGGGRGGANVSGLDTPASGTSYTGGGGGGNGSGGTSGTAGGSGIIIVRYLKTAVSPL